MLARRNISPFSLAVFLILLGLVQGALASDYGESATEEELTCDSMLDELCDECTEFVYQLSKKERNKTQGCLTCTSGMAYFMAWLLGNPIAGCAAWPMCAIGIIHCCGNSRAHKNDEAQMHRFVISDC